MVLRDPDNTLLIQGAPRFRIQMHCGTKRQEDQANPTLYKLWNQHRFTTYRFNESIRPPIHLHDYFRASGTRQQSPSKGLQGGQAFRYRIQTCYRESSTIRYLLSIECYIGYNCDLLRCCTRRIKDNVKGE